MASSASFSNAQRYTFYPETDLANLQLLRRRGYINGEWVDAEDGSTFQVVDPARQMPLVAVSDMGSADTKRAIDAAAVAFQSWRDTTVKERSNILRKLHDLMLANKTDLAKILTFECGKPMAEAVGEIIYGANFLEYYANIAQISCGGDFIPPPRHGQRLLAIKQPIGVTGMITPWNFPSAMLARKIAPAIAAGCTIVAKPSEDTPLSTLSLAYLAEEAGLPKGVLNIVPSSREKAKEVGDALLKSKTVRKISFTGSTAVGKYLMAGSADSVKKLSLELGGNAPFIVFDDCDIDAAVSGCIAAKFRNNGQTCVCVNRIYVHESVHDAFVRKLSEKVKALKVGHGMEDKVLCGPLINERGLEKVERLVNNAVETGADLICGGERLGGNFYAPTVLGNVSREALIQSEEIFGPVAAVTKFRTEDEALEYANDSDVGLAAYFFTKDNSRIWRMSERLEFGIIGVNEGIISTEVAPFGGVKESGLGREGSIYGIEDYLEVKYVCMGGIQEHPPRP